MKINQNPILQPKNFILLYFQKKCIPLYLEDLKCLIQCLGWILTKIYAHFTFEQSRIKNILF